MSPNMKRNNFRRRQMQKSGYVDSLFPTTQVSKVLADISELSNSCHLGYLSASARAELVPHISIKIQTLDPQTGTNVDVVMPKLALMVASPAFARLMEEEPERMHAGFIHRDIDLEAVRSIAKWLTKICSQNTYVGLDVPRDLEQALKLCLTARAMGMSQYAKEIIEGYIRGLSLRVPDPGELKTVLAFTRDEPIVDPIMDALANYTAWLCTYHKLPDGVDLRYVEVLAGENGERFLRAVKKEKVAMIEQIGWAAVYHRPWN